MGADILRVMADDRPGLGLPDGADELARCPVHRVRSDDGPETWLLTGHEDVRRLLADPALSRVAAIDPDHRDLAVDVSLLAMDPPEHTRVRSVVTRAFGARRVNALRTSTAATAERLLDALVAAGSPADLVPGFCLALPVVVISELLGVPVADRDRFTRWSEALMATSGPAGDAEAALEAYVAELLATKRARPGDDLLSELVAARDEAERLTEQELVELAVGILVGGHETTATQLAAFTHLLLRDPALTDRLRAEPALVPVAVEELLRLNPLGGALGGTAPRVAPTGAALADTTVPAGRVVVGLTGLANRDPRVFADPHAVVLDRPANPHLTFGHGAHHCLGSQLARMELQVGITALLTRFPDLRLAVPEEELPWRSGTATRGLLALPVAWT